MLYNNCDCGVAMSPIRMGTISVTLLRWTLSRRTQVQCREKLFPMTAPINLVATAVKASTEDATDGNHVSKLFSTFDASDTPSARKYEAGRIVKNGSVEPVDLSINGSIILNTVTDRYSPGAMCKDTSVVPCRHLKAFLVSDKGVSRTMDTAAKTVVVYASGKLVKIYCVEYIKRSKATVGSPLAGDDNATML